MAIKHICVLNGNLCNEDHWADVIRALEGKFTFHVPDLAGCRDVGDMAERALSFLNGETALLGYSMGGYAAFEVLRRAPEKVPAAVFLSTSAGADNEEMLALRQKTIERVNERNFDRFIDNVIKLDLPKSRLQDRALCDRIRANCHAVGLETLKEHQRAIAARPDSRPMLKDISCPSLVAVGTEDIVTPPDKAREIHAGIAGSDFRVLEGCGHMPSIEKPRLLADLLRDWLGGVSKS